MRAVYRWRIKPGQEEAFGSAWAQASEMLSVEVSDEADGLLHYASVLGSSGSARGWQHSQGVSLDLML